MLAAWPSSTRPNTPSPPTTGRSTCSSPARWSRATRRRSRPGPTGSFPDHLGYGLFRPATQGGPWFLVHRFRNEAAFQRWQDSAERAQWFSNCLGHHHTEIARRELHGMETWFAKPGTTRPAPPRWKMAVSSGLAIFPISLAGNAVLGPYLVDLHFVLRTAAFAVVFSTLMTYLAMPAVSRLLRPWLTK
ncbi:antibiotic biosynthesis monooxygenase [Streptomyces sp. NPDC012746]|uniref:antibiotic biosynthesis monooxygenase n=1 Tax=Streptomyces sp. NPDC012746 TaxID=3364845 RepID=UPI0036945C18